MALLKYFKRVDSKVVLSNPGKARCINRCHLALAGVYNDTRVPVGMLARSLAEQPPSQSARYARLARA